MKYLPNVLIVDDSSDNLAFLESIIKKIKVNLIQALSGFEALEKTRGVELALAIIDVRMPEMDGYELAKKMNSERSDEKVPIIFLTASHAIESQIYEGYFYGAVDYIIKPVDNRILHSKISVFLDLFTHKQTIIRDLELLKEVTDELTRVNATLKSSEEKYRSYIENAPDGVFIIDETGKYLEVNAAASKITGYTKDELLQLSISDILPEDSMNESLSHFREVVKTGTATADLSFRHKNGTKRWWTIDAVKLTPTKLLGFTKDITKRMELEESLRTYQTEIELQNEELMLAKSIALDAAEKYTELYDFAPLGYYTLSAKKAIQELNHSGALILGNERRHLINTNFDSFVSLKTRPVFDAFFLDMFQSKAKEKCEVILETKGNQIKYVHVEGIVSNNNKQCLINVVDISDRKRVEEMLRESEERFRAVTQSANEAIITVNSLGTIIGWNTGAEKIFGYAEEEISGKELALIMPRQYAEKHKGFIERVIREGDSHVIGKTVELNGLHKNGNEFPIELSLADWETASGRFFTGIIRDITRRKKTEKVLRESESNLEVAQRIAHLGSWEWDMVSNTVKWSKEMYSIFDISPDTFDGTPESLIKALHPDDVDSFVNSMRSNLSKGNSPSLEYRVVHKDGSIHNIFAEWLIEFNKAGQPVKSVGTVQDITERKRTEDALRESEELFRSVVNNSVDLTTLTDANGKIMFISPQCESVIGFSPDKFIGTQIPDIIHPDDADLTRQTWEKVLNEELAIREFEYRIIDGQGSVRWLSHSAKMVRVKDRELGIQNTIRNITERKIAEQTLKLSEEKYRTMLNASPDGIFIIDLKGIITDVSEIGLELYGSNNNNEMVGKHFFRFVPSEEKRSVRDIIEKTMNEGIAQNIEIKIRKKNQSFFLCESSTTLIQGPNGAPFSFMIIVRDISQRKKLEKKQIHADRMASLGEMASGIAHEINQPLNTISMVMDNILFEASKPDAIEKDYLKRKTDKIFENITRIRNIIDHVRVFSRSHDDYILTGFDINTSIKDAVTMVSEQFKHLAISLNLQLEENLPLITGNTFKFEQVMLNLLSNAKDALLEKKSKHPDSFDMFVGINSFRENQNVIVEMTDNGTGIREEDIEYIMLPFYTTKDAGMGTGLGLSISYQILKEMQGTIEISSNNFHGTTFRIVLAIQNKPGS